MKINFPFLARPFLLGLAVVFGLGLSACGGEAVPEESLANPTHDETANAGTIPDSALDLSSGGDEEQASHESVPPGETKHAPAISESTSVEPDPEDAIQIVSVSVGAAFETGEIHLEPGTPARLVFSRTTEHTCMKQVKIPAFDIGPVDLPLNEPVAIEFTPTEAGDFTIVCGMDMVSGSLVVRS